jgi:mannonate dehydratase
VSAEECWDRILYFYERIVPVAESAKVKLATHPDDPPLVHYRGVHQVLNSFAGFKRLTEEFESPYNGLLLCLGTMQEASQDVVGMIRYFGERQKVYYVHYRNVRGNVHLPVPKYEEVFQDEGELDMVAAMTALKEVGFTDWIVNDHVPGLMDDTDWGHRSLAWQVGFIRGVLQTLGA